MKHKNGNTLEVSGKDLLELSPVIDEVAVGQIADMAARRAAAEKNRAAGMSWSKAREAAVGAKATADMLAVVRSQLKRGANNEQAIRAAIKVGKW